MTGLYLSIAYAVRCCVTLVSIRTLIANQRRRSRSQFHSYTAYMMAISNNAVNLETLLTKLSDGKPLRPALIEKLEELKENSLEYLCEEVLTDINVLMPDIMTRKWLNKDTQTIGEAD